MKYIFMGLLAFITLTSEKCTSGSSRNESAKTEQAHTEENQLNLNRVQPAPTISWSLERDNLIKRFKLENDRAVTFYMYLFIEGSADPIGYYQVNKVSSVNSQLTNTMQMVYDPNGSHEVGSQVLPSPAEDGSYGTNGDAIFGFTPEDIYIETNCKYITSTVPLTFRNAPIRLAIVDTDAARTLLSRAKKAMGR